MWYQEVYGCTVKSEIMRVHQTFIRGNEITEMAGSKSTYLDYDRKSTLSVGSELLARC